jgi:hypothetical protein
VLLKSLKIRALGVAVVPGLCHPSLSSLGTKINTTYAVYILSFYAFYEDRDQICFLIKESFSTKVE